MPYNVAYIDFKRNKIQITMLERPKISPSQQPKSLGISPSDLASKSLGVKIENGQVTCGGIFKWLWLQDRRYKTGPGYLWHWLHFANFLSSFWQHFALVKQVKFAVSRHFLEKPWEELIEIWQADVSWPPSELIRFWSWTMMVCWFSSFLPRSP